MYKALNLLETAPLTDQEFDKELSQKIAEGDTLIGFGDESQGFSRKTAVYSIIPLPLDAYYGVNVSTGNIEDLMGHMYLSATGTIHVVLNWSDEQENLYQRLKIANVPVVDISHRNTDSLGRQFVIALYPHKAMERFSTFKERTTEKRTPQRASMHNHHLKTIQGGIDVIKERLYGSGVNTSNISNAILLQTSGDSPYGLDGIPKSMFIGDLSQLEMDASSS